MEKRTVRTGFVGSGWARIAQAPAFEILDGVELTAVASPTEKRRRKFQEQFSIPNAYAGWEDLVASEVDLVCISAPPHLHYPVVKAALAAGKHVLCEKPMAMDMQEAADMCQMAEAADGFALLDHELRFHPAVRQVKQMIESGEVGRIYSVCAEVNLASRSNPSLRHSWWSEAVKGGGALGAIGSHLIDLNRFLFGEISEVCCDLHISIPARPDAEGRPVAVSSDDGFSMMMRFGPASLCFGSPASLRVTTVANYTSFRYEVHGSLRSVRFDGAGRVWELQNGGAKGGRSLIDPPQWAEVEPSLSWDDLVLQEKIRQSSLWVHGIFAVGFAFFAHRLVRAAQRGEKSITDAATFDDGFAVQRVMAACHVSAASRRWEKVPARTT